VGGFHIEEQVYGPRFCYPPEIFNNPVQEYEKDFPTDTVLVHLVASPGTIRHRISASPHEHQIVPDARIEEVQAEFAKEYAQSGTKHKIEIDTSELAPQALMPAFFDEARVHFSVPGMLRLLSQQVWPRVVPKLRWRRINRY
jgi:hypothetical protein